MQLAVRGVGAVVKLVHRKGCVCAVVQYLLFTRVACVACVTVVVLVMVRRGAVLWCVKGCLFVGWTVVLKAPGFWRLVKK